ncbi:hypothetical protein LEMLEM_LOCUS4494 [Lemmus lemmus]
MGRPKQGSESEGWEHPQLSLSQLEAKVPSPLQEHPFTHRPLSHALRCTTIGKADILPELMPTRARHRLWRLGQSLHTEDLERESLPEITGPPSDTSHPRHCSTGYRKDLASTSLDNTLSPEPDPGLFRSPPPISRLECEVQRRVEPDRCPSNSSLPETRGQIAGPDMMAPTQVSWGGWKEECHKLRAGGPPRKGLDGTCSVSDGVKIIPYALTRHPLHPESPWIAHSICRETFLTGSNQYWLKSSSPGEQPHYVLTDPEAAAVGGRISKSRGRARCIPRGACPGRGGGARVQRIPEPSGRCPARVWRAHSGTGLGRATARTRQPRPAELLLGSRQTDATLDRDGRSRSPGNRAELRGPRTQRAARRPARAPLRVRHPQSRFRTRHPAPQGSYGEPRGSKSRRLRAGRRAEVSAAAVGPAVVGCAAVAAPWLACRSRAGRPAGLRSGLGHRPGFCCVRLRRGPGRRRRARGRGQATEGGDGVRACGRRLGEEIGPWTRGARCPRLGAAGTEPKMSA